jgi:hypothetical protein
MDLLLYESVGIIRFAKNPLGQLTSRNVGSITFELASLSGSPSFRHQGRDVRMYQYRSNGEEPSHSRSARIVKTTDKEDE